MDPNLKKGKFTGQEGKFISSDEATTLTRRFHEKKKSQGLKTQSYTEAQFFGNDQLKKLMSREDCVGLRFYFGVTEAREINDELVIVAVDAAGRDLTDARIGLKDMPDGRGAALTGGPCCPSDCNP